MTKYKNIRAISLSVIEIYFSGQNNFGVMGTLKCNVSLTGQTSNPLDLTAETSEVTSVETNSTEETSLTVNVTPKGNNPSGELTILF